MPVLVPHAKLAALLGQDSVRSDAQTVGALLSEIEARVGASQWAALSRVTILVNGRNMHMLEGRKTVLHQDDQVWMIVPSGGG